MLLQVEVLEVKPQQIGNKRIDLRFAERTQFVWNTETQRGITGALSL